MKKIKLITTIFLFLFVKNVNSQTVIKLIGQKISSNEYYDYSANICTNSLHILDNAFDGNLTTVYATCNVTGGWVGLDLGEPHLITKISYCPRLGQASRMVLGLFEGANKPDFGDALPLFLITTAPTQSVLTNQTITCSKGFRYVRYIGPVDAKCNISEIQFYGYAGVGDNNNLTQITNLPTVTIHTTNAQDIVDKDTYLKGIVSVISNNGTKVTSDSLEIKGRGNASWNFPKKPYRMKLYNKVSLLGQPSIEKNWTLINNYGDKTLMRNLLAFDLSRKFEIPYTPAGKPVDLVLNGQYKGTYQLCDQIEVAIGRIEVEKMKTTDITLPNLAGGYLIEMDAYANEEISWFTSSRNKIPVTIKYPKDDEIVPAQSAFIKSYFETMETALYASNYLDATNGYRKYIDVETFLRHFLVGEISGNTDTYWSTYMYKKRTDDKFYFGPVWDFDIAFENDYRTYPINNNSNWVYDSKGSTATGVRDIVNRIFTDPNISVQLKRIYTKYRSNGTINESTLLKVADDYAVELDQSQKLNFTKWNILNSQVHMNPQTYGSYVGEVNNVKNYIKNRIIWMDNKLGYVQTSIDERLTSSIYLWNEGEIVNIEGLSENSIVQIMDVSGRVIVYQKTSHKFATSLKKGIYIIQIKDSRVGSKVMKCMIQ